MAIDSRDKRFSMIRLMPVEGAFHNPDSSIDDPDKQQFLKAYRGIAFQGLGGVAPVAMYYKRRRVNNG